MLHIVNKSHRQTTALASCLRLAKPGQALLLTENAIYAATQGGAESAGLAGALSTLKVYVLQPDVEARGMVDKLIPGVAPVGYDGFVVAPVGYDGFVELVVEHSTNQSWL